MVSSFGRGGGPAEGAAQIIPVWCRAALWSLQTAENTKGACGVDQPQSGTHTLPPALRGSALNGQSASFKATAQHRTAAEHARVSIKTEDNTEEIIIEEQWVGRDRSNKGNRWDGFIWPRVRCPESRSRSDYTAEREARAVLCSVELSQNRPGRGQKQAERTLFQHQRPPNAPCLYREWAQGGALQLTASYICGKLETQPRTCHYTDGICGNSDVFI